MITPVQSARVFQLVKHPALSERARAEQQILSDFRSLSALHQEGLLRFVAVYVLKHRITPNVAARIVALDDDDEGGAR
jgi:hypothetical protein